MAAAFLTKVRDLTYPAVDPEASASRTNPGKIHLIAGKAAFAEGGTATELSLATAAIVFLDVLSELVTGQ